MIYCNFDLAPNNEGRPVINFFIDAPLNRTIIGPLNTNIVLWLQWQVSKQDLALYKSIMS